MLIEALAAYARSTPVNDVGPHVKEKLEEAVAVWTLADLQRCYDSSENALHALPVARKLSDDMDHTEASPGAWSGSGKVRRQKDRNVDNDDDDQDLSLDRGSKLTHRVDATPGSEEKRALLEGRASTAVRRLLRETEVRCMSWHVFEHVSADSLGA